MKQYLPYNVLMVIAVVMAGVTLFYNLVLRESFSVFVRYEMPAIPQPVQAEAVVIDASVADEYRDEDNYRHGEAELQSGGFAEETALASVTFPLDINKATEEQLQFIPQVGNVTAQRIVQYRDALGGYTSLEQLMEIKGISEKAYANIAAYFIIGTD